MYVWACVHACVRACVRVYLPALSAGRPDIRSSEHRKARCKYGGLGNKDVEVWTKSSAFAQEQVSRTLAADTSMLFTRGAYLLFPQEQQHTHIHTLYLSKYTNTHIHTHTHTHTHRT